MPIRFRCEYCNRLLGIARRKAGMETTCPHCGYTITVPEPTAADEDLADIDKLLQGTGVPAPPQPPAAPAQPAPPAPATVPPRQSVAPLTSGERPLFEKNLDTMLGPSKPVIPRQPIGKPLPATPGTDATSLTAAGGDVVLNSRQATAVAVAFVVMMALSFVAGFVVASR